MMNEITRIHIAKTAYDIEIGAKKQLEKYIKSLETYTQDSDVLTDIEIRITELLAERGVKAGAVISTDDVNAVRTQLGEPYEFADGEGDIAVGSAVDSTGRRLYRSPDDAVLGGVLSGMAAYFNISPLWTRLVFILLMFISFGLASLAYILFWIIIPPARTATERLMLAGKDVTLESIRELSVEEDGARLNRVAPVLQQVLSVGFGTLSLIAAVGVAAATIWLVIASLTFDSRFVDITNGFSGLGEGSTWIVWLVFWIVVFGFVLLASLLGLIAYAFFTRKITKRLFISCVVILVLGLASVAAAAGISTTQSWRVANETRSMMHETKANLPEGFSAVRTVNFDVINSNKGQDADYFGNNAAIRYVVDGGPARYELSALPSAKPTVKINGTAATISLTIPQSYRNSFVQPVLTIYGPALETIHTKVHDLGYTGLKQDSLTVAAEAHSSSVISGSYTKVIISGEGSVDLESSAVQTLNVQSAQDLYVTAGTVRELTVVQPDVCASGTYQDSTRVSVSGVTSGQIHYNGTTLPAETHRTSCASVVIESNDSEYNY